MVPPDTPWFLHGGHFRKTGARLAGHGESYTLTYQTWKKVGFNTICPLFFFGAWLLKVYIYIYELKAIL